MNNILKKTDLGSCTGRHCINFSHFAGPDHVFTGPAASGVCLLGLSAD